MAEVHWKRTLPQLDPPDDPLVLPELSRTDAEEMTSTMALRPPFRALQDLGQLPHEQDERMEIWEEF